MSKILPPDELAALLAETVEMEIAHQHLEQARRKAAEIELEAEQKGYRNGWTRGHHQLLADIQKINQDYATVRDVHAGDLVVLVKACLEQILGGLPRDELIRDVVAQALADHSDLAGIVLRVPAAEAHEIKLALGAQRPTPEQAVPVIADQSLQPGDLVLVTPQGRVHIGVSTQSQHLYRALSAKTM